MALNFKGTYVNSVCDYVVIICACVMLHIHQQRISLRLHYLTFMFYLPTYLKINIMASVSEYVIYLL